MRRKDREMDRQFVRSPFEQIGIHKKELKFGRTEE